MSKKRVADFLYEDESYIIRGACFQVFNTLGGGIKEKIIERALIKELKDRDMEVGHQVRVGMSYQLGFLINFGPARLTIKRLAHSHR